MIPEVCIGIDMVNLFKMKRTLTRSGEKFLNRIITPDEIKYYLHKSEQRYIEGIASLFAIKEAIKKIFLQKDMNPGWKQIQVYHQPSGKPWVAFPEGPFNQVFENISLSLSHTSELVVAVAVGVSRKLGKNEVST